MGAYGAIGLVNLTALFRASFEATFSVGFFLTNRFESIDFEIFSLS
jgi:hypothetical protein